jgi:hypothetical protein
MMTFLVLDTASNNVLGEYESFSEADACRIDMVGHNPPLAEYIEVVDIDRLVEARRREREGAAAQPA